MTIKGGLKKINELIETIAEDHSLERKKKVDYQQLLVFFKEGQQDMKIIIQSLRIFVYTNLLMRFTPRSGST